MPRRHVDHVGPGQAIGPALRADTWNAYADAANALGTNPAPRPARPQGATEALAWLGPYVDLESTSTPNDAIALDDSAAFTEQENDSAYRLKPVLSQDTSSTTPGRFAVSRGGEAPGVTRGVMSGVYTARVSIPSGGSWIRRAELDPLDPTRLVLHPGGSCQVLDISDPLASESMCIIRFGNPESVTYRGIASSSIANNSSGPVNLCHSGSSGGSGFSVTAALGWMNTGGQEIASGTQVLVQWMPQDNQWLITGSGCPPDPEETT